MPFFVPVHNTLRMRFKWYYHWHLFPLADFVHLAILLIFSSMWIWGIYSEFTPQSIADIPASITLTSEAEWEAGTADSNIDTTSSPGSITLKSAANTNSAWQSLTANSTSINESAQATDGTDLYTFGGERYPTMLASSFKYDVSEGTWSQLADIPQTTSRAAAEYAGGYFYVFSGYRVIEFTPKVYRYDPGGNSWAEMSPIPEPREFPNAELKSDGNIYVWGGACDNNLNPGCLSHVMVYNIGSNSWSTISTSVTLPTDSRGLIYNDNIYTFGGVPGMGSVSNKIYEFENNDWVQVGTLNHARALPLIANILDKIYIFSGTSALGGCVGQTEQFNPENNTSTDIAGGTTSTSYIAINNSVINDQAYKFAGTGCSDGGVVFHNDLARWPSTFIKVQPGVHTSGANQIDGGDSFTSWSTFEPSATIPANTSISFRFRTSANASDWGTWTGATAYSASINLATILGATDKTKRYLQVEATLANTNGSSTPVLDSYTANIAAPICPVGSSETAGSDTLTSQSDWEAGTNTGVDSSSDPGSIKIDTTDIPISYASTSNPDADTFIGDLGSVKRIVNFKSYDGGPGWSAYSSTDGSTWSPFDAVGAGTGCTDGGDGYGNPNTDMRYIKVVKDPGMAWCPGHNPIDNIEYTNISAVHVSAQTQLDGSADISSWTTFSPSGSIPANTSINFRFRTSSDASNWGNWTAGTAYSASIDLSTLLSQDDVTLRYLQVETTLANTDSTSTPTLASYTAAFVSCPSDPIDATCNDGIQNQGETGVDCGGPCSACTPEPTCNDGIQNQGETGVDTGGPCQPAPTCSDGIQNGDETGIDTGGSCPPLPTCSDGIQNGDETGIDTGGSCPPECKLNECQNKAISAYSECQNNAVSNNQSIGTCSNNYCEDIRQCYDNCGILDGAQQYTFVEQPNGGESYFVSDTVAVRWHYTEFDKKTRASINNIAVKLSISTDGGTTYHAIKALIPSEQYNSPLVKQYRLADEDLEVGTYQVKTNSVLEYLWIPGNLNYASKTVRIKLEPLLYNCVIVLHDDASDDNFELKVPADTNQISLIVTPSLVKTIPGGEASYSVKALLANGQDVTSSTTFSYLVTNIASIDHISGSNITLIAGEKPGLYDRALQITGTYQGLDARAYAALEIRSDGGGDEPPPADCGFWCNLFTTVDNTFRGIRGTGSTSSESIAMLFAGIIAAVNVLLNTLSLFRTIIAPLIKGKEKKKRQSTVYDAMTGLAVPGAKVMLLNSELGTLASLSVTDKEGRYSLELSPGKSYAVRVEKENYIQYKGSHNKIEEEGLIYEDSYLAETFTAKADNYIFRKNIPMVEIETQTSASELLHYSRIRTLLVALNVSLLLLGSGLAIVIFINYPTTINYIILSLYILLLLYHIIRRFVIQGKTFGEVRNIAEGNKPVDLAIIRAISLNNNKLAKTVISDIKGRYTLLLPKGKYRICANKEGLVQTDKIEISIRSSFNPRHDEIQMDKAPEFEKVELTSHSTVHEPPVNSVSDIIENYSRKDSSE